MNILNLLNYSPEFGGGIAKHLAALGRLTKLNGHKLYLGFPRKLEWQNELSLNSEIVIIPEIKNALWSGFPRIIRKICKNHSIDILHLHFEFAQAFTLACSIKKWDIPTIYHWHNAPIALNEFLTPQNKAWGKLKRLSSGLIARITDRRVIKQHISISKEITELLAVNGWTKKQKITFLPNGISKDDSSDFIPKVKCKSVPVIGTVANFRPQKDHKTLLNAFSILCKSRLQSELWIIGDGPTRIKMEKLTAELGISSQVRFLGTVLNPAEMYHRFDIFVLSTHFEGHPLVLLEAMSYGLPIIATRVSSIPEVITHGVNGLLVKPEDSNDLALAFQSLLINESIYSKLSEAARKTFEQQLSVYDWANNVIDLYERKLKIKE